MATVDSRVIWAAGFFDGEGCIVIRRRKKVHPTEARPWNHFVYCTCSQTLREPLDVFVDLWGGGLVLDGRKYAKNHSPLYRWQAGSQIAARALTAMLPHLVVKRDQAIEALAFQARRLGKGGDKRAHVDYDADEAVYFELQRLKRAA